MPSSNNYIYTRIPDFYDRVRGALGVSENAFTDDYIDYPENAPLAELRMKSKVPQWAELDGTKRELFESCILYATCYGMFPVAKSKRTTKQSTPTLTIEFSDSQDDDLGKYFMDLVDDLLAEINGVQHEYFFGFAVTKKYPDYDEGCCRW